MSAPLATFPSPGEIAELLKQSPCASEPATDLGTLEGYYLEWPYPKSLDFWEGYVFADLCEQVGWAYFKFEEYEPALEAWRKCPWPTAVAGERQAVAMLLQSHYEERTLILGPPVGDLLAQRRINLGTILSTLDDPGATLSQASSGVGYVVESRLVQPEGLYHLRFEFDLNTLFYVSYLPAEVYYKLNTARSYFQMGEAIDAARWLLRAAFVAQNHKFGPEAFSFLEKALQLDPKNEVVKKSLTNLKVKGISPTIASRVVVERSLFQPDPVSRCARRPESPPQIGSPWIDRAGERALPGSVVATDTHQKVHSLGRFPLERAKAVALDPNWASGPYPLLLPANWVPEPNPDLVGLEKTMSRIRGVSLEQIGLWKGNYHQALGEMTTQWPESFGPAAGAEVVDFALPPEVQVVFFSCRELWQIPALLRLELAELKSLDILGAWWRRLDKLWGARPFLLAEDITWFQLTDLPEPERRELFLADLMNFSSDVIECFEPSMIKSAGPGKPYLFPVPMQMTFEG